MGRKPTSKAKRQRRQDATDDAYVERVEGTREVWDSLGRLVHSEERDGRGQVTKVINTAYFLDGSTMTIVFDFTTSPASVTITRP